MTRRDELLALAERVEALTGPDRDVDAAIAPLAGLRIVDGGHPLGICCYDKNSRITILPSFTRLIHDAELLVPVGWGYSVGNGIPLELPWAWCALPGEVDVVHAATPALALTAAALRALAEQAHD